MEIFSIGFFVTFLVLTLAFLVVTVLQGLIDSQDMGRPSMDFIGLLGTTVLLAFVTSTNLPWN